MPASPLGGRKGEELRGHIGLHFFHTSFVCLVLDMLAQALSTVSGKTRRCVPLRAKTSSGFRAELLRGTLVGESGRFFWCSFRVQADSSWSCGGFSSIRFQGPDSEPSKDAPRGQQSPLFCRAQVRHQQSPVPRNISTARIPKMPCRMPSIGHIETTMRLLSRDMVHHSHHRA